MCEMMTISTMLMAGKSAVNAYSSYQSGQSEKQAADYNAKMMEQSAQDTIQRGADSAAEHRQKVKKMISSQVVGYAASGVDPNTGTPLDVGVETAGMGELDALRIVNNAQREAWGLNTQASLVRYRGKMAGRAGTMNAVGSILGGASEGVGMFAKAGGK